MHINIHIQKRASSVNPTLTVRFSSFRLAIGVSFRDSCECIIKVPKFSHTCMQANVFSPPTGRRIPLPPWYAQTDTAGPNSRCPSLPGNLLVRLPCISIKTSDAGWFNQSTSALRWNETGNPRTRAVDTLTVHSKAGENSRPLFRGRLTAPGTSPSLRPLRQYSGRAPLFVTPPHPHHGFGVLVLPALQPSTPGLAVVLPSKRLIREGAQQAVGAHGGILRGCAVRGGRRSGVSAVCCTVAPATDVVECAAMKGWSANNQRLFPREGGYTDTHRDPEFSSHSPKTLAAPADIRSVRESNLGPGLEYDAGRHEVRMPGIQVYPVQHDISSPSPFTTSYWAGAGVILHRHPPWRLASPKPVEVEWRIRVYREETHIQKCDSSSIDPTRDLSSLDLVEPGQTLKGAPSSPRSPELRFLIASILTRPIGLQLETTFTQESEMRQLAAAAFARSR
ncbi:hypothetical protein C8J57DRAFT_1246156 [Mycena rebaudengoi]|nr:hypothetical protein C8J57DRAFT_1246156 [Mycena rebaudengoi]